MTHLPRYDVLVLNGANQATEFVQSETIRPFGGMFANEMTACMMYNNGAICARVYDRKTGNILHLVNIEW